MDAAIYDRDTLINDLRSNVLAVTFTKENGETRTMRCTLMLRHLPVLHLEEEARDHREERFHKENLDIIKCWDMELGAWRSFKINSVQWCQSLPEFN